MSTPAQPAPLILPFPAPPCSALPGQMTGREVLRMYGRLRGLPEGSVDSVAQQLLRHLGLQQYADR